MLSGGTPLDFLNGDENESDTVGFTYDDDEFGSHKGFIVMDDMYDEFKNQTVF